MNLIVRFLAILACLPLLAPAALCACKVTSPCAAKVETDSTHSCKHCKHVPPAGKKTPHSPACPCSMDCASKTITELPPRFDVESEQAEPVTLYVQIDEILPVPVPGVTPPSDRHPPGSPPLFISHCALLI